MTAPESKGYWVYIAELKNGQLYVGMTDDLSRRTGEHLQGKPSTRTTYRSPLVHLPIGERDRSKVGRERRNWRLPRVIGRP
jgi:predicted GIY-YIG superfamily endonuclease